MSANTEAKCRYCGCTENRACVIDGDPCYWVVPPGYRGNENGVCSNPACVDRFHAEEPDEELAFAEDLAVWPEGNENAER
jgi:hypothetical protein